MITILNLISFETMEEAWDYASKIIASIGSCGAVYYVGGKIRRWFVREDPDQGNEKNTSFLEDNNLGD